MENKDGLVTEFQYRKEPIVLTIEETCKYINVCPYKKINCMSNSPNRHNRFICDIEKLKNLN